jgi:hypothetical protein
MILRNRIIRFIWKPLPASFSFGDTKMEEDFKEDLQETVEWRNTVIECLTAENRGQQVEVNSTGRGGDWRLKSAYEGYRPGHAYRVRKEQAPEIIVNGMRAPAPYKGYMTPGENYWVPYLHPGQCALGYTWKGDDIDIAFQEAGLVYLNPDAANQRSKAMMRTFDALEYDGD